MKIFSFYRDFFKFLDKIPSAEEKWKIYLTCYYQPHKDFLKDYFSHFPLIDFSSLKQRVEKIKASDYSWLRHLISSCGPEKMIRDAYKKCQRIVAPKEEPEVYLIIGFFSPDGFVMNYQGKSVICFGLERFKDFRLLRIIFAHEYAHFLLKKSGGKVPEDKEIKWLLLSEGIGTYFSLLAFPESRLYEHFLFARGTLNWCQRNEAYLRKTYSFQKFSPIQLMDFYIKGNPELNIPPRAGKYLGFQAVKKYLTQNRDKNIGSLLSDKKSLLSLFNI